MGWPGPMTHRQFLAWKAWRILDINRPDKTQSYLMSIAAEVRRSYVKKPRSVRLEHLRLVWKGAKIASKRKLTEAQKKVIVDQAKSRWIGFAGKPGTVKTVTREEAFGHLKTEKR